VVLVNPSASGGRAIQRVPAVISELDRLGAPHRVVETRSAEHAGEVASAAPAANETVLAVGGDGSLRPLAKALRGTDAALALVPAGRGNDLARVLGVPGDATAAARLAVEGDVRAIDVAEVDGVPYLGIASFGFDSEANAIANRARLVRGRLVYLYAGLRVLATWRQAGFTVVVDGRRHEVAGYSIAVANSSGYGGGMRIAPAALLDDGLLDVVATGRCSKLRFLRLLVKVFRGTHVDDPSVVTLRGAVVEVAADRDFEIYADGDPIGTVPARMTLASRSLYVIVPASR